MSYIKKIILRYLLFIVYLFSFIFPRNKNKWLFGSLEDFGGNAKYVYIHIKENRDDIRAIWLTKNKSLAADMQGRGVGDFFYCYSLKGIYHLFTSGVYVTTHELSKALTIWSLGRAKWVNLWHGVGIKALRFDSNAVLLNKIYKNRLLRFIFYPYGIHLFYKPFLFLTTSPLMSDHFQKSFDLDDDKLMLGGYPRCFFIQKDPNEIINILNKYESRSTIDIIKKIKAYSRTYIYMPTWRKSGNEYVFKLPLDLDSLQGFLEKNNQLFLLKLHPLMSTALDENFVKYPNIIKLEDKLDVYSILPFTDTLICDYSSVYYDYILIPHKNIILFPFDYKDFISNSRDLAFDFNEYTPGKRVFNYDQLLQALIDKDTTSTSSKEIIDIGHEFWNFILSTNDELVSFIKNRL